MSDYIEIAWSTESIDEARKVSRFLVQERMVASATIIPWVEAIYLLNGQLETTQESTVVLRTQKDKFGDVKRVIEENSSYAVPEISYKEIKGLNEAYSTWINSQLA